MGIQPVDKNLPKATVAKQETPPPAKGYFSNWTWTDMAKYGAVGTGVVLLAPQLWETVKKIPDAAMTAYSIVTTGVPVAADTVVKSYGAVKSGLEVTGGVIGGVRSVFSSTLGYVTTIRPVPTTPAEKVALGGTFFTNFWGGAIASSAVAFAAWPVARLWGQAWKVTPFWVYGTMAIVGTYTAIPDQVETVAGATKALALAALDYPILTAATTGTIIATAPKVVAIYYATIGAKVGALSQKLRARFAAPAPAAAPPPPVPAAVVRAAADAALAAADAARAAAAAVLAAMPPAGV